MFRFAIRDLLWLTLLAAIVVAWWVDRNRLARQIDALDNPQVNFGGVIPRIIVQPDEENALGISLDNGRP